MIYQIIDKVLQQNESDIVASEAHGLATGMLCIDANIEAVTWLNQVFPEENILIDEDKTILVDLFEQTRKLLNEEDDFFRFDLFLPGEDEPLNEQLQTLCLWCEGFLFGIGYSQSSEAVWPGETDAIMKDIVEFTKMETELDEALSEQELNENETALIEIQEYLRVAVIIIRDQFLDLNNNNNH